MPIVSRNIVPSPVLLYSYRYPFFSFSKDWYSKWYYIVGFNCLREQIISLCGLLSTSISLADNIIWPPTSVQLQYLKQNNTHLQYYLCISWQIYVAWNYWSLEIWEEQLCRTLRWWCLLEVFVSLIFLLLYFKMLLGCKFRLDWLWHRTWGAKRFAMTL
jgi:hypothetical protein